MAERRRQSSKSTDGVVAIAKRGDRGTLKYINITIRGGQADNQRIPREGRRLNTVSSPGGTTRGVLNCLRRAL